MLFKWPPNKPVHRLGYRFISDDKGSLSIDIDNLKKKVVEIDEEGVEFTTKEAISTNERSELLSALTAYGFSEVKEEKASK